LTSAKYIGILSGSHVVNASRTGWSQEEQALKIAIIVETNTCVCLLLTHQSSEVPLDGRMQNGDERISAHKMIGSASIQANRKKASPAVGVAGSDRVFARLRDEVDQAGKEKDFNCLKGYLTGEAGAPSYQEAATELEMTEGAVKVAVHGLRRRYRDLVREEIAQTVAGPDDVDEELRHLFAALH
jgi:hypothetical protein